jgi:beta-phosphoglucomutase-like phosphatase (HAD superfamily)
MAWLSGILFDLDGTLVDSEAENGAAAAEAVRGLGAKLTASQDAELREHIIGRTWADAAAWVLEQGLLRGPTLEVIEEAMLAAKLDRCRDHGMKTLPLASEAVRWAAGRGQVAVVSGSRRVEIAAALEALGLSELVPAARIVGAEDYPRGKPAPDPYLEGAKRLELLPKDCLAVEDSRAGIASARTAGLRVVAVAVGNFAGQDQSAADLIIPTLAELEGALRRL